MLVKELIDQLGYADSPHFLRKGTRQFATAPHVGHIFRTAAQPETAERPSCSLRGVYVLQETPNDADSPQVPLVYVCKANSEAEADEIHRLVWNQDAVPFLIVHAPKGIKFYSGFEYTQRGNGALSNLLAFNEAQEFIRKFHRDEIDSGRFWHTWTDKVQPQHRVNWKLLQNLQRLDHILQHRVGLSKEVSHGLIGKYVYLHYLRDRDILSDRKLASWNIKKEQVFGQTAALSTVKHLIQYLDEWLNGNVFPIPLSGANAETAVRLVAGVFSGDDVLDSGERQLSLDFQAYDFSFIPIETLSVVYEQFLHEPELDGKSRGREAGAYYTPIPVVNFMLAEMEERIPLGEGVTVLDPACGSGAFLVQCYRRLIEKKYPQHPHQSVHPIELRKLLVDHIFGLDRDADACSVAELSLTLTLLDYVDPPDLENDKRVKLPALRGTNIFHSDFFHDRPAGLHGKQFDWVIGNPPWKKLNPRKLRDEDRPAWNWMKENEKEMPVGGNQLARAFAWGVDSKRYVKETGEVGLFLPAMTLFDKQATGFRQRFFQRMKVTTVANFSNLAEVIADGRFRVPAASFFYSCRAERTEVSFDEVIRTFSPLVANQEATKPRGDGERKESWCIVVNDAEIHDVPWKEICNGEGLPWKIAAWGSHFDQRLLKRLGRRFQSLRALKRQKVIKIDQGPDLSDKPFAHGAYETVYAPELKGKKILDTKTLARLRHVFSFPASALRNNAKYYVSKRSGLGKLRICHAPHVIVSAARNFAVYSDDYLVIPSRQIGIISESDDSAFLKALSLFLSSDFAFYHQFFASTQFGVQRGRATLNAILQMPMPLSELSRRELQVWTRLYAKLISTTPRKVGEQPHQSPSLFADEVDLLSPLVAELNQMVFDSLGLSDREQALVNDLVNIRLALNDGKVGEPATGSPNAPAMRSYARRLKKELDVFLGDAVDERHKIDIVYEERSGMVCIDLIKDRVAARTPTVEHADRATSRQLTKMRSNLRVQASQWVYFDRNLRIDNGTKTFLFKPMQRFHWTESQAMIDASEIIAETTSGSGASG